MSQASRSYQLAVGQMPVMLGMRGRVALERHLHPDVLVALEGEQVIDDGEIAGRLALRGCARTRSSMAVRS